MGWNYHKSEENRLVLVDPLQSLADEAVSATQVAGPSPICQSHCCSPQLLQPAGRRVCVAISPPSLAEPARLANTDYFNSQGYLAQFNWGGFGCNYSSSAVAEAALTSAKRGLQGAGAAWRHHLLKWPQSTWKGCTDTRWLSLGEPSSN